MPQSRDMLRFLTAGSVDDGKSTLIGRLLYESGGVHQDQLDSIRKASARTGSTMDLSLVTDGLKAEREQAITIDVAYRYFSTKKRKFIIADVPGHEQYTRNMVTGASTADAVVLLVEARKGILEQTRRHAYIAWLLGIRRMVIAINKMDLVGFNEAVFRELTEQFRAASRFMHNVVTYFLPVSALTGDNVAQHSDKMSWYAGPSLLELLETLPLEEDRNLHDFRFAVQYVVRPNQDFRGYAGQVASGIIRPGDPVVALPSGNTTRIQEILLHTRSLDQAFPPQSVVLTLTDEIDLARGDMLVAPEQPPAVTSRLLAEVVWMSHASLRVNVPYLIKHGTQTLCCSVLSILHRTEVGTLEKTGCDKLCLNEIGLVEIQTHKQLFVDSYAANRATGRFILIDPENNETVGAGMISAPSSLPQLELHANTGAALPPNLLRQNQRGLTVWLTGLSGAGKTTICNALYTELLARGFRVEVLDGDVIRKLFCSDLGFSKLDRDENIRRIGLVAELLTRNGAVVLVSAISPYRAAREEVRSRIGDFIEVYVNTPLEICEQRDPKGLYRKARRGEIAGFTGIDDPYEAPLAPDVECHTDRESLRGCTGKIMAAVLAFFAATAPRNALHQRRAMD
ncbi:MAG TPA: adenylyl-sulfate kinase [Candidatus Angelobacter sp.]|nr:adenylyl-sulfate kinase [Candidatus Angelobacter sp.]